jgi:hypothetical protein
MIQLEKCDLNISSLRFACNRHSHAQIGAAAGSLRAYAPATYSGNTDQSVGVWEALFELRVPVGQFGCQDIEIDVGMVALHLSDFLADFS